MLRALVLLLFYGFVALALEDQLPLGASVQPVSNSGGYDPFAGHGFDAFVEDILQEYLTPGLAIAVVHGNATFTKAYGWADIDSRVVMTPRTLFLTGSTTKSFTAAIASQLVHADHPDYAHIGWDSKLAELIRDDFVLQDTWTTAHVTLSDALSHRTGMPRHDFSWTNGDPSTRGIVRSMRHLPLSNELRWTWEYCNLMYIAVGHAIETITGTSLAQLFEDWIWTTLGMRDTFYSIHDAFGHAAQGKNLSVSIGYIYDEQAQEYAALPFSAQPPTNGAGSIISNVQDYTLWLRTFLQPNNISSPLPEQAIEDLTKPHMVMPKDLPLSSLMSVSQRSYGLGLQSGVYRGNTLVSHGGNAIGWMTEMAWLPDLGWGVVVMQNAPSFAFEIVTWKLLDDFLHTPENERFDMAAQAKDLEREARAKFAQAQDYLYPNASKHPILPPALPLKAYEGVYEHPAYRGLNLTIPYDDGNGALPNRTISLNAVPAQKSFSNMTVVFHHVSGEYWYARTFTGPGSWLADSVVKARFELSVDGRVKGLGLQAEPSLDGLAWFEKIN